MRTRGLAADRPCTVCPPGVCGQLLTLNMLEVLHADHTTATNLFQEARRASKLEQLRKYREDALKAGGQVAGSQ